MKAICFEQVCRVSVTSLPDPVISAPTDAIVRVQLAGLCGSDLHPFFGRESGLDIGTAMGHEFVGSVVEVGEQVRGFSIGDVVCSPFTTSCGRCFYCESGLTSRCKYGQLFGWRQHERGLHGGQAEYVRVPLADGTLCRLPDGVDHDSALLLGDNLSTAYFGIRLAVTRRQLDERAALENQVLVVIGCGTVGLLAVQLARKLGASKLIAIDPNESRLEIAKRLGAMVFTDADSAKSHVDALTDVRGADCVMEFVGLPEAQRAAFDLLRPGGRMSVIGCHCTPDFAFTPVEAYDKNLSINTGRCPARRIMDELPARIDLKSLDLSWCITHRFPVEDGVQAYETFSQRKDGCVKAVISF